VRWMTASLDTPVSSESAAKAFWVAVTDTEPWRAPRVDTVALQPRQGDPFLQIQVVKHPPARVHLVIHVDDVAAEVAHGRSLGARLIAQRHPRTVLASPGGFLFGVTSVCGKGRRPPSVETPGGRSLVDQICIDAHPMLFEPEAAFWSALTGWERRPTRRAEFEYLDCPRGIPLRVLLQRLDDGPQRAVSAHLDFACDDVDAQVRHHQTLGAVLVRRTLYWATMRDPAGREYCLTARNPDTGVLGD
jgi:Glyoxalase-like domain